MRSIPYFIGQCFAAYERNCLAQHGLLQYNHAVTEPLGDAPMSLLAGVCEKIAGKRLKSLRCHSIPMLVWKQIRKYINVSCAPYVPLNVFRIWLYRLVGYKIGKKVFIGMQCYLDDVCPQEMVIEDNVTISYRVTFACHGPRMENRKLVLREGCYIGTSATVLGGGWKLVPMPQLVLVRW
ncbi:MAG: hypothetical protein GXY38_07880 [Planctomycetes bacterium]|nr:hypothetical protein [Planctomycetota bacterium]